MEAGKPKKQKKVASKKQKLVDTQTLAAITFLPKLNTKSLSRPV